MIPRRTLPALLVALLATLALVAGLSSPASAAPRNEAEKAVAKLTNVERAKHDRVRLSKGACVQRYADRWAKNLARRQVMEHQDLGPILRTCRLSSVGENVAVGYPTARSVVRKGWMRSEGHRANILAPQFRKLGVGVVRGQDGRRYYVQVFGAK